MRSSASPDVELAMLDLDGVITATNAAWKAFGGPGKGPAGAWDAGASYLGVCATAGDPVSLEVAAAIRAATAGGVVAPLTLSVPCEVGDLVRAFDLFVSSRFDDAGDCVGATLSFVERTGSAGGYTEILDAAPDGLLAVDVVTGAITYANARLATLVGCPVESLVGRPVEELVPLQMQQRHVALRQSFARRPVTRYMGEGRVLHLERTAGPPMPVEVSLSPGRLDGRDVVVVAVRDVTDRLRLEARERLVAQGLDAIDDGVVIADADSGRRVYANRSVRERMGGGGVETFSHVPLGAPSNETEDARIQTAIRAVVSGARERVVLDTRVPEADGGAPRPVEMRVSFLPAEGGPGDHGHVILVSRDIRERLAAEERLRDSEEMFRSLFEASAIPTLLVRMLPDGSRIISRGNAAAAALFGTTAADLAGASGSEFTRPEDEATATRRGVRIGTGKDHELSLVSRLRRRDGTQFWAEVHGSAVELGVPTGRAMVMQLMDVTERVATERFRERRAAVARLVAQVATDVLSGEPLPRTYRQIVGGVAAAFGAADVALWMPVPGGHEVAAAHGLLASAPSSACRLDGAVGRDLVRGLSRRGRVGRHEDRSGGGPGPGAAARFRHGAGPRSGGVIVLWRARGEDPFSEDELTLLADLTHQLALAVELGRARTDQQRLLLLEERERVARDLHDTVVQDLIATGMQVGMAAPQVAEPAVRARLDAAVDQLEEAVRRLRGTVFDLREPVAESTLTGTVEEVVLAAARALGHEPEVALSGPLDDLAGEVGEQVVAALREALSNVIRHAGSTWCRVRLSVDGAALSLVVEDDGTGPPGAKVRGDGLRNLRARARALGGTSSLRRRSPSGSRLVWRIPAGTGCRPPGGPAR